MKPFDFLALLKNCPVCGDHDGFHHEEVHAARPIDPPEKSLPLPDESEEPRCRACGWTLSSEGEPGCRYPNHGKALL